MSKITFKVGDKEFAVRDPSAKENQEGQKVYNKAFREAVESGFFLKAALENVLKQQGVWTDEDDREVESLRVQIIELEDKLRAGGIKKSEAKAVALKLSDARNKLLRLRSEKILPYESQTAESQAQNSLFTYHITKCLVYNDTGKPYFQTVDAYLNRKDEDEEIAKLGTKYLVDILYGFSPDTEQNLAENKFLKDYGFVNDKYQLIDSQGRPVDRDGRLINEEGRYIDENGNFVDRDGNPVTEDGKHIVEFKPFLDD